MTEQSGVSTFLRYGGGRGRVQNRKVTFLCSKNIDYTNQSTVILTFHVYPTSFYNVLKVAYNVIYHLTNAFRQRFVTIVTKWPETRVKFNHLGNIYYFHPRSQGSFELLDKVSAALRFLSQRRHKFNSKKKVLCLRLYYFLAISN